MADAASGWDEVWRAYDARQVGPRVEEEGPPEPVPAPVPEVTGGTARGGRGRLLLLAAVVAAALPTAVGRPLAAAWVATSFEERNLPDMLRRLEAEPVGLALRQEMRRMVPGELEAGATRFLSGLAADMGRSLEKPGAVQAWVRMRLDAEPREDGALPPPVVRAASPEGLLGGRVEVGGVEAGRVAFLYVLGAAGPRVTGLEMVRPAAGPVPRRAFPI